MMQKSLSSLISKQLAILIGLALAPLVTTGCDDGHGMHNDMEVNCDLETRAQTYVAGLAGAGSTDVQIMLMEAIPGPPRKDDNTWRIQVMDSADAPLTGLNITVTPWMPDHGHGTSVTAEVTELLEAGEYELSPVNLRMPGLWETTIEVDDGAELQDAVVFSFCIEG